MKRLPERTRGMLRGFTLIEMLVVITIMAVLAALLIPALGRARATALTASSSANLKQIHLLFDAYVAGHGGTYPTARGLNLPTYGALRGSDIERIAGALAQVLA